MSDSSPNITKEEVVAIRNSYDASQSMKSICLIAGKYGLSTKEALAIIEGVTFAEVEGPRTIIRGEGSYSDAIKNPTKGSTNE